MPESILKYGFSYSDFSLKILIWRLREKVLEKCQFFDQVSAKLDYYEKGGYDNAWGLHW